MTMEGVILTSATSIGRKCENRFLSWSDVGGLPGTEISGHNQLPAIQLLVSGESACDV